MGNKTEGPKTTNYRELSFLFVRFTNHLFKCIHDVRVKFWVLPIVLNVDHDVKTFFL